MRQWRIGFIVLLITSMVYSITIAQDDCADRTDNTLAIQQADMSIPAVGEPVIDPAFCTQITRISDSSESGNFETQEYSQLQAFSGDNAYVLLVSSEWGYLVRRMDDYSMVEGLEGWTWNAARWYPPEAHTLIHFDSNEDTTVRVQLTNVDTGETRDHYTFPADYEYVVGNRSSDELSHDGRWMSGVVIRSDGAWVIFSLDIENSVLGAEIPIFELYEGDCEPDPEWGPVDPDWIGVSPLGNYLMVQWTRDGTARCSGLESFDIQTGEFVGRVYDGHQHGDLGVTEDGMEFFMTFEIYHPSGNMALGMRELPGNDVVSEPVYLQVLDWGNGAHISCQGPPGVCLVTADSLSDNGWTAFEAELFLQYTDGRVERLAHHRSTSCGYWVQPRASISRDGRYVIFASDWGNPQQCEDLGRGDPYIIDREA